MTAQLGEPWQTLPTFTEIIESKPEAQANVHFSSA
jgi:hypothetical protein